LEASLHDPTGPHPSVRTFARVDIVENVKVMLKEKIEGLEEVVVQVEEGHGSS